MTAVLSFREAPGGFAPFTEFALDEVEGAEGLFTMWSVDDPGLRVYVVDPETVHPGFRVVIPDKDADSLGLRSADDVMILAVANPTLSGVNVNLRAPVVVNAHTGAAAQILV